MFIELCSLQVVFIGLDQVQSCSINFFEIKLAICRSSLTKKTEAKLARLRVTHFFHVEHEKIFDEDNERQKWAEKHPDPEQKLH